MINLLPPKIKREQKLNQISRQINTAILALIAMTLLTYAAVFLVNYFLSSQLIKSDENLTNTKNQITKLKPIEDNVASINQKLAKLATIKSQRFEWSAVLADIDNSIPAQVQVNAIQLDKTSNKMSITAAAETRSDIVKLQAKLEDLPYFKNMSFESSTFDEKSNYYTFSMSGTITK